MLNTKEFGSILKKHRFTFFSGIPCSYLKYLINYAINDCNFVMSASEGDAVAICAGAHLAGKKSVLLCQNSGLANALSPLTSLNPTFEIPLLGFVSLRGEPGKPDQPQHQLMGKITTNLLDVIGIDWEYLSDDIEKAKTQIATANNFIENNKSFFFVVKKNTFDKINLSEKKEIKKTDLFPLISNTAEDGISMDETPTRLQALEIISKHKNSNTILLAPTGATGRELYEIEDRQNNLYMVGSMGCVSSIGLGICLAQEKRETTPKSVIAIDGDGALLMRFGALATNGNYLKKNMLHILLDNNAHDSTGGQETVSHKVDFVSIAANCGYQNSFYTHNLKELDEQIKKWKQEKQLTFIYLKIARGQKKDLGRPKITPIQVKERLMKFIESNHD